MFLIECHILEKNHVFITKSYRLPLNIFETLSNFFIHHNQLNFRKIN